MLSSFLFRPISPCSHYFDESYSLQQIYRILFQSNLGILLLLTSLSFLPTQFGIALSTRPTVKYTLPTPISDDTVETQVAFQQSFYYSTLVFDY